MIFFDFSRNKPPLGNLKQGGFVATNTIDVIGTAIPPRYGGDFPSLGGIPPGLQTPQGGETPPNDSPRYRGGFLNFEGGLGGDCQNLKIIGLPPGTGGTPVSFRGDLSPSSPQAENFGATMINKPLGNALFL